MAGHTHELKFKLKAFGDDHVEDAHCDGQSFTSREDLIDQAVTRIVVIFDIAAEGPFVKKHAVDDAAAFAGRGGLDGELGATCGDRTELAATCGDFQRGVHRAGQEKDARFELVIHRPNKGDELGAGVGELELSQKVLSVRREDAIGITSYLDQKLTGGIHKFDELLEQRITDCRAGIIEQAFKRVALALIQLFCIHG